MPPTSDLQRKMCDLAEFKLTDEGNGGFSGYGSVFSVLDRQGEIVAPGAFTDTLPQFEKEGFIAVSHDWDRLPVGSIKACRQDEKGLWIDAEFHSTPEAQACRTYVRERLQRGKSVGLSIGYWVRDDERTKDGRLLKQLDLAEVSVVTIPANPAAGAARAKAEQQQKATYLGEYAEQDATWSMLDSLHYSLQNAIFTCLFMGEGTREECLAAADGCLAEYHAMAMQAITALYPADMADTKALAAEVKAAWHISDPSDPPAGKEFDAQIDEAHACLADLIVRSREIALLRAKSGRTLSAARRQELAQLHTDLGALIEETAPKAPLAERLAAELAFYARKAELRAYG
jgi:HK97 family phage prohead protease